MRGLKPETFEMEHEGKCKDLASDKTNAAKQTMLNHSHLSEHMTENEVRK